MTKTVLEAESQGAAESMVAAIPSLAVAVPPTLHASLMARLDRLGPAREVAQVGSVIGRGFSYDLLRDVASLEDAPLQAALEKLAEAGGRKPINAKCETVRTLPTFRDAYRRRRCILPVDGFFEWKAIKGQKAKQPYAIAMKDGSPFGLGGLWEN